METFKAFLDYFTPTQWKIIYVVGMVLIWMAGKLTDRHFRRKSQRRKLELQRSLQDHKKHHQARTSFPPE